jgi:protein O-mannosyl-transferase
MKTAWKSTILGGGLLVLMIVAVYWPVMRGGFTFDDSSLIVNNQMIHADNGLYRIWFTSESLDYWPVTYSAWWLQWRMWGGNAAGFHAVNVGLHAIDTILVWMVLRRLKVPGAWLGAAAFGVHPINVATVAWISEQKNTLSMLFYAVSILLYLKFDEKGFWKWYVLSLIAFVAALLSKTSVVMMPVVLLGLAWWMRGRISWKDIWRTAPFFALSLAGACVTIALQQPSLINENANTATSFPGQAAAAGWALWFYLYQSVLPLNLMLIYPNWKVDATRWISYVPAVALIGVFGIFWWKRKSWGRPLLFGLGYFAVTLFPVLGFFHQFWYAYSRVADHWMYGSIIGVLALLTAAAATAWRRIDLRWRYLGAILGTAVFLSLFMATWKRNALFADQKLLWRDNIERNPDAWAAYNNLAVALGAEGKIDEAIHWLREAIRIKDDYVDAYNNLGNDLVVEGKVDEAMADYRHAWQIYPEGGDAQKHMAEVYWRQGNTQKAIEYWKEALDHEPDSMDVLNNLAWVLATTDPSDGGDPSQAVALAQRACELTDNREATDLDTLGVAYAAQGKFSDAAGAAEKGIELARADADEELAKKIEGRLQLYRAGKAYSVQK